MKYALILMAFIFSIHGYGQNNVIISNGTVETCSGTFYDSGFESNYGSNENFTFTICPDESGNQITVDFQQFSLEEDIDFLTIYHGSTVDANNVAGLHTGTNSPGKITSTSEDGCLTFLFSSDDSIVSSGWRAEIDCNIPCQTINSQIDTASPAPNSEGYIQVCVDETINLTGSGTFSESGAGATYQWDLGDGRTIDGQNATFSYDTPGIYLVNLNIRDINTSGDPEGCPNTNFLNQVVQVSTDPNFTGTMAEVEEICLGSSTTIFGEVEGTYFQAECTPPVSDTTPLPDVVGERYRTGIIVDCFEADQTLQSGDGIVEICMIIEHSWADDLDIRLIAPDGRSIDLFLNNSTPAAVSGTGVYLGGAIDGDGGDEVGGPVDIIPGEGRQYCFRMDASIFLKDAPFVQDGSPLHNSLQPGNYLPVDAFSGLVGSPLNGQWILEIVDTIDRDNGVIFEWKMDFNPNLLPAEFSFTPEIVAESWDADPSIETVNGNNIEVRPANTGQHCYTYRVTDNFGCEYTETVCIDVFPAVVIGDPVDYEICDNIDAIDGFGEFDLSTKDNEILAGQPPSDYEVTYYTSFNDADQDINPISTIYNNTSNPQTIFARVEFTGSNALCYAVEDFDISVDLIPDFSLPQDIRVCTESNGSEIVEDPILDTGLSDLDYNFEWSLDGVVLPNQTSSSIVASQGGEYSVLVTDVTTGCTNIVTTTVTNSGPPELSARVTTEPFADRNTIEATASGLGDYEYSLNDGEFQTSGTFNNVPPGLNVIVARDINGCGSASVSVTVLNYPKFFSPNGDGSNDFWRVKGLSAGSAATIYIYDRYGKLLKQLSGNSQGWDGKFNGDPLPSSDYWFSIDFDDPSRGTRRNFKAHFSLIR